MIRSFLGIAITTAMGVVTFSSVASAGITPSSVNPNSLSFNHLSLNGVLTADRRFAHPHKRSCWRANRDGFDLTDMTAALTAIRQGNAEPYIAEWSNASDVTLFGAWGPIEQGYQQLADTFQWVASRYRPEGEVSQDIRTFHASGNLAVTVGFERGPARVDGGEIREMVIRVTHVYRCEDGDWKLVHRHADFPTVDPRPPK